MSVVGLLGEFILQLLLLFVGGLLAVIAWILRKILHELRYLSARTRVQDRILLGEDDVDDWGGLVQDVQDNREQIHELQDILSGLTSWREQCRKRLDKIQERI